MRSAPQSLKALSSVEGCHKVSNLSQLMNPCCDLNSRLQRDFALCICILQVIQRHPTYKAVQ